MKIGTRTVIFGRDLRVGDVIVILGDEHRVDRLEPYTGDLLGELGKGTRIAYSGASWGMTVPPDQLVYILPRLDGQVSA